METKVAICIPTTKRFDYLKVNVPKFLAFDVVDQVVISDSTGEDIHQIKTMCPEWASHPKLLLYRNTGTYGAYFNKMEYVKQARPGWIALIDSDNSVDEHDYFGQWKAVVAANGLDENKVYMAGQVNSPEINRVVPFRHFGVVDKTNIHSALASNNLLTLFLLNNGNYIVHTKTYKRLYAIPKLYDMVKKHPTMALDAAVHAVGLLSTGCVLQIVPEMTYHHVVHPNSLVTIECETNKPVFEQEVKRVKKICAQIEHTFHQAALAKGKRWIQSPLPPSLDTSALFA